MSNCHLVAARSLIDATRFHHALRGCNEGDQHHPDRVKSAGRARSLVIVAAAEAANQVSYSEGNGGSRVWALLYGCAKEILSPAGGTLLLAMAVSFLSVAFSSSRFC
jgi:hypothetical protein